MSTGRLERGPNLALIESIRRQKITEMLAGMKLGSKLRGMAEQQMEDAETGEDPFDMVNLEDTLVSFFRMMICDLKEALDREQMELEMGDLIMLKEATFELFGKTVEIVEELKDWDNYLLGLFHEINLVVYKQDISVKAIEKIALESVEGMYSDEQAKRQIEAFRKETRDRLRSSVFVPATMKKELAQRVDFLCSEVFENMRESFSDAESFMMFALEQINRHALENYEGIAYKLAGLDQIKAEIIGEMDPRYGRILADHSDWIADFMEEATGVRPVVTRKALWDAIFDLWANELVKKVQEKQGTGKRN